MTISNNGIRGQPTLPYTDYRSYAGADVFLDMTFVDHTMTEVIPTSLMWQLDNISDGVNMIAPSTSTPTAASMTLQIPGAQMQMTFDWRGSQLCQFSGSFTAIDSVTGNPFTSQFIQIIELCAIQTPESATAPLPAPASPTAPTLSCDVVGSDAELTWTAATVLGSTISAYLLYRSTDGTNYSLYQTLGNVLSYDDNGLTGGDEYWYYVMAQAASGATGAASNIATASIPLVWGGLETFVFDAGNNVSSDFSGFSTIHAFGSLVSGGGIDGATLTDFFGSSDDGEEGGDVFLSLYVTGSSNTPPQAAFNEISLADANGNAIVLTPTSGTYQNATFGALTYDVVGGNVAKWTWTFVGSTSLPFFMFTTSTDYTATVS